ncbi:MAG TPA: DTW domain-containing protein [Polyangiaceae bacterium]|nr:DTW domain-containing protein [Polyangiaceae bacterium]
MGTRSHRAARCRRCRVHIESCVCAELPCIELATRVVLVMHQREASKTTATGPLALACLPNSAQYLHGLEGAPLDLTPLDENGARRLLVLFPTEGARTLSAALRDEDERPITLVVPDGNWRQARRIPQRVRGLEHAEHVGLPLGAPSAWGVRWEPMEWGLATFEAIARAIGVLESADAQARLEAAFARVVALTLAARGRDSVASEPVRAELRVSPVLEPDTLEIVYRDEHLVAVNKPPGVPSHHGWSRDVRPALQRVRDQIGQPVFPVHRLDRATSGVLVFALSSEVARDMQRILVASDKRYIALCRGHDSQLTRVDHPLAKAHGAEPREAVTEFRLLGSFERYGLYEARPRTGRTHQIRRHLKHVSQPIVGDVRYGKGDHNRLFRERFGFHRLALHCHEIRFDHPRGARSVRLHAALSPGFARLLEAIGLSSLVCSAAVEGSCALECAARVARDAR